MDFIAWFAARFVGTTVSRQNIAVGDLDGIDLSEGHQQGQVPVKGAAEIDPNILFFFGIVHDISPEADILRVHREF